MLIIELMENLFGITLFFHFSILKLDKIKRFSDNYIILENVYTILEFNIVYLNLTISVFKHTISGNLNFRINKFAVYSTVLF